MILSSYGLPLKWERWIYFQIHKTSEKNEERKQNVTPTDKIDVYGTCTVRGQYAYRTVRELGICGPAQGGQGTSSSSSNSQRFVRELCRRMAPTCATWAQLGAQTGHENPLPLICVPLAPLGFDLFGRGDTGSARSSWLIRVST